MVKFVIEAETGVIKDAKVVAKKSSAPKDLQQCVVRSMEGLVLTPPDARDGHATFVWDLTIKPQTNVHSDKKSGFGTGS